ncbi:beta-N-acetylhexosaminidase [Aliihoeflea aestuarii]|jgi:beta-N-acetylhexosaminidase|uniref:beta-N-acetylhexosaminidase n=1 Tax=Aliihoeflea aestuarii TaxID=453840 RepID=UPI002092AA20|nr:beta-N-acetylhexosaminidase [Aliihoeflea aestuarii]MCO6390719.1 beta-N-acetylhexosaminidase [Aliihoeflea aestuarii]
MSDSKALILGASGTVLSRDEQVFFANEAPWGFILFARNLSEPDQIRDLVASMRESVGRPDAPVFIDQEGGRVQRLRPPLAGYYPPADTLGRIYTQDREAAVRASWLMSRLHALDLIQYGINADCLPVLDVPVEGAHDVIGDRAYAHDPEIVAILGKAAAEGLLAGGVMPVIKHIPGHGRAFSDSHHALPVVDAGLDELRRHDFVPFKALCDAPAAMTAHVVYTAIDAGNPATTSPRVISEFIRGEIGFDGLLMSDDLSMKALSGDFATRTRSSLAAGCDMVLHCNGDMAEMKPIAQAAPVLAGLAKARAVRAIESLDRQAGAEYANLRQEFEGLIAV